MDRNAPPPIRMELGTSWPLALLLGVAHGGAFLCLMATGLAGPVKILLGILIGGSLFLTLCEHAFRCSHSAITTLSWTEEDIWRLRMRDGQAVPVRQAPPREPPSGRTGFPFRTRNLSAYARPYVVVLRFRTERGGARSVVLHPGMVDDTDMLRRLRIRLRFRYGR
uniref:Toxin CptA n=1 Tax=Candidatus Kentrum sp. DK TaxID=2126562 RepID=A0A450SG20_9GAMM|nr:MAG: hypothetical protein BECKDK2373C_GA0170839_103316 [Candidatus Kentron sp. DK]VFJ53885.1 MAG: hypothetical protein BECKDK2373B_GA0170837_104413 [Candidatus Kentron sp. DK]